MAAADNEIHEVVSGEHGGALDQLVTGTSVGLAVGGSSRTRSSGRERRARIPRTEEGAQGSAGCAGRRLKKKENKKGEERGATS